jgi:hypothetical protein
MVSTKQLQRAFSTTRLRTLLTEVRLTWFEDENEDANEDSESVLDSSFNDDNI